MSMLNRKIILKNQHSDINSQIANDLVRLTATCYPFDYKCNCA